jgi:penicillin V acylase-like amidase (Ntn superfamily)
MRYSKKREIQIVCLIISIMMITMFYSKDSTLRACTAFNYTQNGVTLVGNNEDWTQNNPSIKAYPAENGKYGRIYVCYWWGALWMPFAGVNDQGLMFDIFVTEQKSVSYQWNKPFSIGLFTMCKVLQTCATVVDAVEAFKKYNIVMDGYQLFLVDKSGNSVVIGGGEYVFKKDKYQVVANHFIFDPPGEETDSVKRFNTVESMLQNLDSFTVEKFASMCKKVSKGKEKKYSTRYSYVINLNEGLMYFFKPDGDGDMDYENMAVLDIIDETSQSMHSIELDDLT